MGGAAAYEAWTEAEAACIDYRQYRQNRRPCEVCGFPIAYDLARAGSRFCGRHLSAAAPEPAVAPTHCGRGHSLRDEQNLTRRGECRACEILRKQRARLRKRNPRVPTPGLRAAHAALRPARTWSSLAAATGLRQRYLMAAATGRAMLAYREAERVARVLGVDPEILTEELATDG